MSPSTLADIALFSDLPETELQLLEQRCRRRKYGRNEQILARDSDSRDVYFVISGAAQVASYAQSGRVIMLDTIPAGGHFGELSAIDDQPRSAIVTATEDSLIASMSPMDFDEVLSRNAEVMRRVLKRLAHIIRDGNERITDLNTLGSVHRVYVELLRLAGPDPAVPRLWSIYPLPTQADLAARAHTSGVRRVVIVGRAARGVGAAHAVVARLHRDHCGAPGVA